MYILNQFLPMSKTKNKMYGALHKTVSNKLGEKVTSIGVIIQELKKCKMSVWKSKHDLASVSWDDDEKGS